MPPSTVYCDNCGAANRPRARFCVSCGKPQTFAGGQANTSSTGLLAPHHLLKQRYRIIGQLGQGGFGAVYKAEDMHFGEALRAVKEMSQSGLNAQELNEAIDAFKREAVLLAGLMHPNLPRIYDHFSDGGRWYLVMDYIEGETLETHLDKANNRKLPIEEVLSIGIQLSMVLSYLHTRQPPIIFRDLKPANVMLTADGHLYLIDFGIARHFKPGQAKDTVAFGSPGYAAPEQYGKVQTTASADIYSLGATLHQLISGSDPSLTPFQFAPLRLGNQPGLVSLKKLIMRMVETSKDKRPSSMAAIKQELQKITMQQRAGHTFVTAPNTPATPQKTRKKSQRKKPSTKVTTPNAPATPQKTKEQWLEEGNVLIGITRYQEALTAFEQAIRLDPNFAVVHNNKGWALNRLGRYQEGLIACEQAIRLDPNLAYAYNNKGWALNSLGRYQEALTAFEQAIRLDPNFAVVYNNKGWALNSLGRYQEALTAFEQAIRLDPNLTVAYNNKSYALNSLGRYQEIMVQPPVVQFPVPQTIARPNPPTPTLGTPVQATTGVTGPGGASITAALVHIKAGRIEPAYQAIQQAYTVEPNNALVHKIFGQVFARRQPPQTDLALQAYTRSLQLDPNDAETHKFIGDVWLFLRRQPLQGIAPYIQSLCLKTDDYEAHQRLAQCYEETNQLDPALREYLEAARLAPKVAAVQYALGQLAKRMNQFATAECAFVEVLRINPADHATRFLLAQVHESENKLEDALRESNYVVSAMPTNQAAQAMLHRLRGRLGR